MVYYRHMVNKSNESLRIDLGQKLKKARSKSGLTQAQVAESAELNVNYYARVERGEVNLSFEKLHRILRVLKIKSLDI